MKKIYLVDSENVGDVWVPLLVSSQPEDVVLVFYTQKSPHMNYENVRMLKETEKEAVFIKCFEGSNALDFQLVTELGYQLRGDADCEYVIVSNDTGFDAAVRYWAARQQAVSRLSGKECYRQLTNKKRKAPGREDGAADPAERAGQRNAEPAKPGNRIVELVPGRPETQVELVPITVEEAVRLATVPAQKDAVPDPKPEETGKPAEPEEKHVGTASAPEEKNPEPGKAVRNSSESEGKDTPPVQALPGKGNAPEHRKNAGDSSKPEGKDNVPVEALPEKGNAPEPGKNAGDSPESEEKGNVPEPGKAVRNSSESEGQFAGAVSAPAERNTESDPEEKADPAENLTNVDRTEPTELRTSAADVGAVETKTAAASSEEETEEDAAERAEETEIPQNAKMRSSSKKRSGRKTKGTEAEPESEAAPAEMSAAAGETAADGAKLTAVGTTENGRLAAEGRSGAAQEMAPATEQGRVAAKDRQSDAAAGATPSHVGKEATGGSEEAEAVGAKTSSHIGKEQAGGSEEAEADEVRETSHAGGDSAGRPEETKAPEAGAVPGSGKEEPAGTKTAGEAQAGQAVTGEAKPADGAPRTVGEAVAALQPAGAKTEETDAREKVIRTLFCCISREHLVDFHNALVAFLGEDEGKELYQEIKGSTECAACWAESLKETQKERFEIYCQLVFSHSEYAADAPEDFAEFLYQSNGKRKNLNSLRAALQGHYGKDKGMKYYSLFKSHIKIMNHM